MMGPLVAAGEFTVAGARQRATFGIPADAPPAASVYSITLREALDPADSIVLATLSGTTAGRIHAQHTNDTTIIVSTFTAAGAAADRAFYVGVFKRVRGAGAFAADYMGPAPYGQSDVSALVASAGPAYQGKVLGLVSPPAKAASVFTMTPRPGIADDSAIYFAQIAGVTAGLCTVRKTGGLVEVRTFDGAGAAADRDFFVFGLRTRVG